MFEDQKCIYHCNKNNLNLSNLQIANYIENEVNTYIKNVDPYRSLPDFYLHLDFNPEAYKKAKQIKIHDPAIGDSYIEPDLDESYELLASIVNKRCLFVDGKITLGGGKYELKTDDAVMSHMEDWAKYISDDEVDVYNYIYNTKGAKAAYEYIKSIAGDLDNRWLAGKRIEDQEQLIEEVQDPEPQDTQKGKNIELNQF